MIWRRVAEVLRLHHAVRLMDEREQKRTDLIAARRQLNEQSAAIRTMDVQSRLGSYARVRLRR